MKKNTGLFQYYVEGENEKKLINVLKTNMRLITPGKVETLNVTQEKLSDMKLRTLKFGTILVFVFDTDVGQPTILNENIIKAKNSSNIKDVYCIPQVKNLEDELVRTMELKDIKELLNSNSSKDYKRDMLREKDENLKSKFESHNFDIQKLWAKNPGIPYDMIPNNSDKIKL